MLSLTAVIDRADQERSEDDVLVRGVRVRGRVAADGTTLQGRDLEGGRLDRNIEVVCGSRRR